MQSNPYICEELLDDDDDDDEEHSNHDNNNNDTFGGGSMDMSQDCIVWNESGNRDLRATVVVPAGSRRRNGAANTCSDRPTGVLDHLVNHPHNHNHNHNNRHSYPPASNNNNNDKSYRRKRSDSTGTTTAAAAMRGKMPRRNHNISPLPLLHHHHRRDSISSVASTGGGGGGADFDDLLQEMQTPSPAPGQATAASTTSTTSTTWRSTRERTNERSLQATNKTSSDEASSHAKHIRPTSLVQQQAFQQQQQPKPVQDKENVHENVVPPHNNAAFNKPPLKTTNNKMATTTITPASNNVFPSNKQSKPTTAATKDDEFEDEFGDLEFSDDLFAQVDSLVAATQQQYQQPTSQVVVPSSSSTTFAAPKQQQHKDKKENEYDDDDFDDFPDIDFEALDQAIATQQPYVNCASSSSSAPTSGCNHTKTTTTTTTISNGSSIDYQAPPVNAAIRNPRADEPSHDLSFTRYKVRRVENDANTFTKTLFVQEWETSMLQEEQRHSIHKLSEISRRRPEQQQTAATSNFKPLLLRGSLYYIQVEEGDVLHLCSLTGKFKTDSSALPVILNTTPPPGSDEDDLAMILHPDMLSTPTGVTKMLGCGRRAVVTGRLGSSGMSSKKLLFGTMRHSLFEVTLRERNFTPEFVQHHVNKIVRKNAQAMISCNLSSAEAEQELNKMFPQLQAFEREFFNARQLALLQGKCGQHSFDIRFAAKSVSGVEEPVIAPELGLKGNLDVIVEADIARTEPGARTETSLIGIELKTNHNTNSQTEHMAQLGLYTMMLLSRFGKTSSAIYKDDPQSYEAIAGGMLLYLNGQTLRAEHVSPNLPDIKNLIEHRNIYSSDFKRSLRPRGVALVYENDDSDPRIEISKAPPAPLPEVQQSANMCSKCFAARECMLYATAEASTATEAIYPDVRKSHSELVQRFTEQLGEQDFQYFLEWDRLIDLEAGATTHSVAEAWLQTSEDRERATGKSISSLVYDGDLSMSASIAVDDDTVAFICLKRSADAVLGTPLSNLHLSKGSYVTCSTDTTSRDARSVQKANVRLPRSGTKRRFRHQMHIFRGTVEAMEGDDKIIIRASRDDERRLLGLIVQFNESGLDDGKSSRSELHFRLDNDELTSQMGSLRQNLVNLFTREREEVDEKNRDHRMRHEWMKRRLPWLREVIVQLRPPAFDDRLKGDMFNVPPSVKMFPGCDPFDLMIEFSELNVDQQKAAEQVTTMKDYSLIQGLPGTGKTSTIVFLTRLLAAQGKRVLITSYTHSAVDNVMMKLLERELASLYDGRRTPALVRIGNESSCHPDVKHLLVPSLAAGLEGTTSEGGEVSLPSAESIRSVMSEARVVGATALTVPRSPLLLSERFDVVIVDEAGQISQPALLGALAAADSFILVGDHMQLPPLVQSELADIAGYGVSMLKRLAEAHPDAVQQLKYQYRMHPEICKLASDAIYDGKLVPAVDVPRLQLPGFPKALDVQTFGKNASQWMKRVLNPFRPVVFVSTDAITNAAAGGASASSGPAAAAAAAAALSEKTIVPLERTASRETGGAMVNETEAALVRVLVHGLIASGLSPSSIGCIVPFRAQIRLLEDCPEIAKWKIEGLEISTIDRAQGREKEVIILSFVRSNALGRVGRLLEDQRRLNVAITRAKHKMIMVGSSSTLSKGSPILKQILGQIQSLERVETLPREALEDCPSVVMSQLV